MRKHTIVFYLLLTFMTSGCSITYQKEGVESPTPHLTLTRQSMPPLDLHLTEAPRLEGACDSFQFEAYETWDIWYTPSLAFDAVESDMTDEMLTLQLFCQWLQHFQTIDTDITYKLDDYMIQEIEISYLTRLVKEYDLEFAAKIIYSVKPHLARTHWVANGIIENDWITNKFIVVGVYIEDGFYKLKLLGSGT